jgi:hypothetical protein
MILKLVYGATEKFDSFVAGGGGGGKILVKTIKSKKNYVGDRLV